MGGDNIRVFCRIRPAISKREDVEDFKVEHENRCLKVHVRKFEPSPQGARREGVRHIFYSHPPSPSLPPSFLKVLNISIFYGLAISKRHVSEQVDRDVVNSVGARPRPVHRCSYEMLHAIFHVSEGNMGWL